MNDPGTVLVALCIGVLAGLGVGSGGLLVIWLTLVCAVPQLEAQSANLLFFLFASGTSLLWHFTHRSLDYRAMFSLAGGGIAGAYVGSLLASSADPALLRSLFGVLLIVSGAASLSRALRAWKAERKDRDRRVR